MGLGLLVLLAGAHIANDGLASTLAALLPTLREVHQLSATGLALLVAALSFSSSVTQPLLGALADRLGPRLMAAAGVATGSVLISLIGLAPSVSVLVALLLIGGLGSAAFHPSAAGLARQAGGAVKDLAVATFSSSGTIGLALGPIAILWLVRREAIAFAPLLMVPGLILGGLLLAFGPRRALPVVRTGNVLQWRLLLGPVGLLSLAGILRSLAYVAFSNGAPLWLVERGFAPDAAIISTTLAVFSLSAGVGALLSGTLAIRLPRTGLMVVTMVLAVPALLGALAVPPGSVAYFGLVALGGALANAALPLMVVSGQDLAPHAMGTATGMMLGLTWGTAGILYIGVGRLQEVLGVTTATSLAFLTLLPAAILVAWVMRRWLSKSIAHPTDRVQDGLNTL